MTAASDQRDDQRSVLRARLLFLIPLAVGLVVLLAFLVGLGKNSRELPSVLIDKPVPRFDLPPLLEGKPGLRTADLAERAVEGPVLVNFFASWCQPCRVEHPLWMHVAKDGKTPVHGVAWKDDPDKSRAFLAELGDPYTRIGIDRDNKAGIEWGVYGVPETYVIDAKGLVRFRHAGPVTREVWTRDIQPLLNGKAE